MKTVETVYKVREYTNEHGVKKTQKIIRLDKVLSSGKIVPKQTEFLWFETIGDFTHLVCRYKTESGMKKAMEKYDFDTKD